MKIAIFFFILTAEPRISLSQTGLEIIGAVSAAVSAGSSLAGTTISSLMNDGYPVTCGIEVENWTRFPLLQATARLKGGELSIPPNAILPGTKEVMVAHKTAGTATGVYGTVSWLISGKQRRLVVMWSAPYNFNYYSNWLGVGLTTVGVVEHGPGNTWFDHMYYGKYYGYDTGYLCFDREEYYWQTNPVIYRDNDFEVVGTMGTTHKAQVKIIFAPLNVTNLARQFQK